MYKIRGSWEINGIIERNRIFLVFFVNIWEVEIGLI